jgi:hypothetical protein
LRHAPLLVFDARDREKPCALENLFSSPADQSLTLRFQQKAA